LVVDELTDHRDQLFGHRVDDAVLADEGFRVFGAPPMEVRAARAPVTSVPLRDASDDVSVVFDLVVASKRQLPADLGLQRDVTLLVVDRHDVQRTSRSAMKVGSIEEDARVLDEPGDDLAVLLHARRTLTALGLELPLVGGQSLGGFFHAPLVLFVREVRSVTTTALDEFGRRFGQHALAPGPEDALPVALEEGHVEHPRALAFRIFETDPLVGVRRY
jgi:hypothetical protein